MLHSLFSKGRVTAVIVGLSALLGMVGAAHAQDPAQNPRQAFGNAAMWPWTLMQNAGAAHPSSAAPGSKR